VICEAGLLEQSAIPRVGGSELLRYVCVTNTRHPELCESPTESAGQPGTICHGGEAAELALRIELTDHSHTQGLDRERTGGGRAFPTERHRCDPHREASQRFPVPTENGPLPSSGRAHELASRIQRRAEYQEARRRRLVEEPTECGVEPGSAVRRLDDRHFRGRIQQKPGATHQPWAILRLPSVWTGTCRSWDQYDVEPGSTMALNTAAIVVGRLLEVRAAAGYRTVADVDALFDSVHREIAKLDPTRKVVTVVDWRQCPLMASDAADQLLKRMIGVNSRTERSCAIASLGSPTTVLQFMRLIREGKHRDRQMFFDEEKLIAWLTDVLTPTELERLRVFLSESSDR
jgi:hypothetical protein